MKWYKSWKLHSFKIQTLSQSGGKTRAGSLTFQQLYSTAEGHSLPIRKRSYEGHTASTVLVASNPIISPNRLHINSNDFLLKTSSVALVIHRFLRTKCNKCRGCLVRIIIIIFFFIRYGYLLSQAFSSWYFSWTSGDPHRSGFKLHTAVLSVLCVMF